MQHSHLARRRRADDKIHATAIEHELIIDAQSELPATRLRLRWVAPRKRARAKPKNIRMRSRGNRGIDDNRLSGTSNGGQVLRLGEDLVETGECDAC